MADKTTIIINVIIIAMLAALFIQRAVETERHDDSGNYDFCVEWDKGITRENIIWKAYNFREQKINWDWRIEGYDELVRFNPDNPDDIIETHYCVRAVKSIKIEDPPIAVDITVEQLPIEEVEKATDI